MGAGSSNNFKILFLGLEGAGKTSLVDFCNNGFKVSKEQLESVEPTVGHKLTDIKHKKSKFTSWDVSGAQKYRDLWKKYYKDSEVDAIVWVVDSTADDEQLDSLRDAMSEVFQDVSIKNMLTLVVYNKKDLSKARNADDLDKLLDIDKVLGKRTKKSLSISCSSGEGIIEGFDWLGDQLKKKKMEAELLKKKKEKEKKNE
jgi:ADP-ribosylation factor-like protein 6